MATLVTFAVSLVLIVLLFVMKSLEIYYGRKIFLEKQFEKFDAWISRTLSYVRFLWRQVNLRNARLIFLWLADNVRQSAVDIKRRFDHQQSHFFTKRNLDASKHKNSPSFFLKDVSDYKKKLREGKGDKN